MKTMKQRLKSYRRTLRNDLRRWRQRRVFATLDPCPLMGLTYDSGGNTDGAGAQLLRIYALYALARLLKVHYIHTPLARLDYQGLQALETRQKDDTIVHTYNQIFSLPSDTDLPQDYDTVDFKDISTDDLLALRERARRENRFILARVLYPYNVTDLHTDAYGVLAQVTPFQHTAALPLRIALHVRRGDLFFAAPERLIGNQYYLRIAREITASLDRLGIPHVFELYTEVPTSAFTVTAASYGLGDMVTSDVQVTPDLDGLRDFDALPHLRKFINTDPVETLQRLATADILVMSRSAFSYLAGLLNPGGIMIYNTFRHPPMPHWLRANDTGQFAQAEFERQVEASLRQHPI